MSKRFIGKYADSKRKNAAAIAESKARQAAWLANLTASERREYKRMNAELDANRAWRCAALSEIGITITREEYNAMVNAGLALESALVAFGAAH